MPPKKGYIQITTEGEIPLLIDAYYTSRGEAYLDRSIYMLSVQVIVGEEEHKAPDVKFTGLVFLKRLDENNSAGKMLDDMMKDEKGIYIPPRSPR